MNVFQAFAISGSALDAERMRVDVAAMNLAYANVSRMPDGRAYQPMRVVLGSAGAAFRSQFQQALGGVQVAGVEPVAAEPRRVHEPGHPDADAQGFVSYPGVNHLTEMTTIMSAVRSYEANLAALAAAKSMAQKALDIGGGS